MKTLLNYPAIMKHFDIKMAVMQIAIVVFLTTNCLVLPALFFLCANVSGNLFSNKDGSLIRHNLALN